MPDKDESKTIKVYGDKYAKAKNAIPAYERVLHTREVTFMCVQCGNTVTEHHFPGPTPRSCEHCRADVQRQQTRERVKRSRQKKKELSSPRDAQRDDNKQTVKREPAFLGKSGSVQFFPALVD